MTTTPHSKSDSVGWRATSISIPSKKFATFASGYEGFVDTNVLIAVITDEPDSAETAAALLDSEHECITSLVNLMELRTVLAKKERLELDRVQGIQDETTTDIDVVIHDTPDMVDANQI